MLNQKYTVKIEKITEVRKVYHKKAFMPAINLFMALLLWTGCCGTPQNNQAESDLVCSMAIQISNNQICYQSSLANNSTQGFAINTVETTVCVLSVCGLPRQFLKQKPIALPDNRKLLLGVLTYLLTL